MSTATTGGGPMSSGTVDLLRKLGSGVRGSGGVSGGGTPIERAGFAELLQRAQGGGLASGRAVEVGAALGLHLTPAQLQRLSAAVDRAEAAGARSVIAVIDGTALKIDVATRRAVSQVDLKQPGVMTGVDGFVNVGPGPRESGGSDEAASGAAEPTAGALAIPMRADVNPGLAGALGG